MLGSRLIGGGPCLRQVSGLPDQDAADPFVFRSDNPPCVSYLYGGLGVFVSIYYDNIETLNHYYRYVNDNIYYISVIITFLFYLLITS